MDAGTAGETHSAGSPNVAGATNFAGSPGAGSPSVAGGDGEETGGVASGGSAGHPAGAAGSPATGSGVLPSEACGGDVPAPTDGYQEIQVGTEARRFILHLPPTYDRKKAFPAITTYHSKGDGATQWDSVKFYYKVAAGAGNVLVYMEALADPKLGGDLSFERDSADDLLYVDAVVTWLRSHVCFDTNRLFALGHSNGATFVQDLGCHRPKLFRAIATHAGDVGSVTGCGGAVPAWVSYGDGDNANQIAASKTRRDFWTTTNGCSPNGAPADPAPCLLQAACTSGKPVEFCEDTMGDHKWSAWMSGATASFFASF